MWSTDYRHFTSEKTNNTLAISPSLFLPLLNLCSNKLTGIILGEVGNLHALQFLRLYDNQLDSIIPRMMFQLKSLTDLQV
ncbi:putative non-specific serine/threonine protein kinase [Helianthus anomalus]